jgi:hypothetical protein
MNPERNDSIIDCFTGDPRKKVFQSKSRDGSISASASKSFSNMGGQDHTTGGSNMNEMSFMKNSNDHARLEKQKKLENMSSYLKN